MDEHLEDVVLKAYKSMSGDIEIVEEGEWEYEYKDVLTKEIIINLNGNHYRIIESRCGNYYDDFEVEPTVEQVVPVITQMITWEPV